jgi:glycosyltransferase involved in cell wall biosynthesis
MIERPNGLAFLCHPYHRGGVTRWMVDAAAEWVERGNACWFVTPRPREPFASGAGRPALAEMVESLSPNHQPALVTPDAGAEFEFGTEGYRARVYARAIVRGVPQGVPVVVSDDPAAWRAVAILRGRNPLIGVLHADETGYYALASRFRRAAAAIVSVSQRIRARANTTVALSGTITEVIPCGIPLPAHDGAGPPTSRELRLIWVGRINETQKRVSDLCAIARTLLGAGQAFRLDIIGDGEDAPALHACVERHGLADHVRLLGWMASPAVLGMLRKADLMLLPSNFEGMPVAAMEALASGCAVVGSDTCGLEEYLHRASARDALWIYPRGDVTGAANAIRAASQVPRERRHAAARRFAEEEFAIGVCMDRYMALRQRLPSAAPSNATVGRRHPGDLASWLLSRARLMRAYAGRRVPRRRGSPEPAASRAA